MKGPAPSKRLPREIERRLSELLEEIPFVRLKVFKIKRVSTSGGSGWAVEVNTGGKSWRLVLQPRRSGEPRLIRSGIQDLATYRSGSKRTYGVLAAPYVSEESRKICKEAGVGFIDEAGNCRLVFDQIFVERLGAPNPRIERRSLRSIFSPKASRILRVLLEQPKRRWKVQDLAVEAKVSLGLVPKVKERLLDLEYARKEEGLSLSRPEELLRRWSASYSYLKSQSVDSYGSGGPGVLEQQLVQYCRSKGIRYGLALFSGAGRVAPFARYLRGFAYVDADPGVVASALGWKPVPSGANFTLLRPFDEGLWYGSKEMNEEMVMSDVQLYLDLASFKGRGEEAAEAILEQRLRPQW